MRWLLVVLLAAGCARRAPVVAKAPAAAPVAMPVTLKVVGDGERQALVAQTEKRARDRLLAGGHPVVPEAAHEVEIEITSLGGVLHDGAYEYCVTLTGRVVRDGARFAAFDVVKEKCDFVRFTSGAGDPIGAAIAIVLATVKTVELEHAPPKVESKLYVAALDELTDVLGRQAVRRD
jgi:hypothetical protein